MKLHYDAQGLVPVVVQDEASDKVLLVAFMNEEALELTLKTGFTHFYSRSRQRIWRKGEQSGHVQEVRAVFVNCEENSLLLKVAQKGDAACHDGYQSCYYRRVLPDGSYQIIAERLFDPKVVYKTPDHQKKPFSTELMSELENKLRQIYGVYESLRDQPRDDSNTSKLLQKRDKTYLISRVSDELGELFGVVKGEHQHDNPQDDTILESSQVCYWLFLVAASGYLSYDQFMPHSSILNGYHEHYTVEQARERLQDCLTLLDNSDSEIVEQGLHQGFAFVGWTCAKSDVEPLAPADYDLAQLRQRGLLL